MTELQWGNTLKTSAAVAYAQISGKIINNANFSVSNLTPIFTLLCWQWWVWHACPLIWIALNLMSLFWLHCKCIIWLEKWTWAKLYKTVHLSVHMISCLNCTVQLTDSRIVNNLKRHFKLICSHPLAWTEGHVENYGNHFATWYCHEMPSHVILLCMRYVGKWRKCLIFVESCDARTLLGTVTRLFIPASVHGKTCGWFTLDKPAADTEFLIILPRAKNVNLPASAEFSLFLPYLEWYFKL